MRLRDHLRGEWEWAQGSEERGVVPGAVVGKVRGGAGCVCLGSGCVFVPLLGPSSLLVSRFRRWHQALSLAS